MAPALLLSASACAMAIQGQRLPDMALVARPADFEVPAGVAVLHYYGAGGWGIRWGQTYILAAPYFTNHSIARLAASKATSMVSITPDVAEVRAGFAGTPVQSTLAILIGHGHIDHAGDVPAYFADGLIAGKPTLVADRSTVNLLAALAPRLGCIAAIDYDNETASNAHCPLNNVRITPIHHAHAPHVQVAGVDVAAYGGFVQEPQPALPTTAAEYKVGNTWAFLIDFLDDNGAIALRIHYVDAASSPPHGLANSPIAGERDVDVHIACVPGYELSEGYPDALLRHHRARFVLAGHWEDFFEPRSEPLKPLTQVLDTERIERFLQIVDTVVKPTAGAGPINKPAQDCAPPRRCGPRSASWALPIPGETFHFGGGVGLPATSTAAAR